jgi:hypothetical protein
MATSKLRSKRGDGSKQPNVVDKDDGAPLAGVLRANDGDDDDNDDDVPRSSGSGASKEEKEEHLDVGVAWRRSRTQAGGRTRGFRFTW